MESLLCRKGQMPAVLNGVTAAAALIIAIMQLHNPALAASPDADTGPPPGNYVTYDFSNYIDPGVLCSSDQSQPKTGKWVYWVTRVTGSPSIWRVEGCIPITPVL